MEVIKKNYSRSPWRLVTDPGMEVQRKVFFDHPDIGGTWVLETVSGDTKKECNEKAMEYLEFLFSKEHLVVKNLLTRSRNLLSHPEHWLNDNQESRQRLSIEIATFLNPVET